MFLIAAGTVQRPVAFQSSVLCSKFSKTVLLFLFITNIPPSPLTFEVLIGIYSLHTPFLVTNQGMPVA
jgi:hypothetical protein